MGNADPLMDIAFTYGPNSNITAMTDNLRPERSQSFAYDPVSRLTSANGGYGDIAYGYNAVGDRTSRSWTQTEEDGSTTQFFEDYSYDQTTARLTAINDNSGVTMREFDYAPSGQVTSDTRTAEAGAPVYDYGLNARGRIATVTQDGALVATYTYDIAEQRVAKTLADGTAVHYHYDDEGRLIAETDGLSGETLREYVWLGLTPVASYVYGEEEDCTEEIAALEAQIADLTSRIDAITARIPELAALIADKQARMTVNAVRTQDLEALITDKQSRIAANDTRITELGALITDKQSRISANETRIGELDVLTERSL